jgi:hypothetical protein
MPIRSALDNEEALFHFTVVGTTDHFIHARRWRSLPQPLLKLLHRHVAAAGNYFHTAIGKVACMTMQAKAQRLVARTGAKKHTLHFAADQETRDAHGRYLPIAALKEAGVIGPMKCFATLPSGAIR